MRLVNVTLALFVAAFALLAADGAGAYERYNSGCQSCHGAFDEDTSTKGSVFPSASKHEMHRANGNMNTDCDLCHTAGDGRNPFIGSSTGTADNVGLGCVGCHGRLEDQGGDAGGFADSPGLGAGLRQHHANNSVGACAVCHNDTNSATFTPVGEHFRPPYYGTVDTNAAGACNPTQAAETNENWTVGEFVGLDNDGDNVYDGSDTDCPAAGRTAGDFLYDGKADILWRNALTGQNWLYQMNGAAIADSAGINTVSSSQWQIVGNGDYDGNGTADILWRNGVTGQNWLYLMAGTRIFSSVGVNTVSNAAWQVVGNGDYNGDGKSDILWRNASNGQNWVYLMDGANIATSAGINEVKDLQWQVIANGDYNGDGRSDILWRHAGTGLVWVYLMNGTTISTSEVVASVILPWQVVGDGDYNGDGKSDILWRRESTGQNWVYLMNGSGILDSRLVNTVVNTDWQVESSGDFDGDGNSDVLWRNTFTGQNWVYLMDGHLINSSLAVNAVTDAQWQIVSLN